MPTRDAPPNPDEGSEPNELHELGMYDHILTSPGALQPCLPPL
jgi:hypothetical protein